MQVGAMLLPCNCQFSCFPCGMLCVPVNIPCPWRGCFAADEAACTLNSARLQVHTSSVYAEADSNTDKSHCRDIFEVGLLLALCPTYPMP